jgi:hypothetical protein
VTFREYHGAGGAVKRTRGQIVTGSRLSSVTGEVEIISTYTRAVARQWWAFVVDFLLVATDVIERIFGTWLLPPTWAKVIIAVAVLVVAQYRAYRELWLELQTTKQRKTKLIVFPEPRSFLYVETPAGSANAIGFYVEFNLGIQNDGVDNSIVRRFELAIEEIQARFMDIAPSRRNYIQTRRGQQQMRNLWISEPASVIVIPAHDARSGILAFYLPGDPGGLPNEIHCTLRIEDTTGTSAEHRFNVSVVS